VARYSSFRDARASRDPACLHPALAARATVPARVVKTARESQITKAGDRTRTGDPLFTSPRLECAGVAWRPGIGFTQRDWPRPRGRLCLGVVWSMLDICLISDGGRLWRSCVWLFAAQ